MIKYIVVSFAAIFFSSFGAGAQTLPQKMEQVHNDPKTAERAAKADVYIIGHKVTDDSTAAVSKTQKQAINKKKRKGCKKK